MVKFIKENRITVYIITAVVIVFMLVAWKTDRLKDPVRIASSSQEFVTDNIVIDKTDNTISLTCIK